MFNARLLLLTDKLRNVILELQRGPHIVTVIGAKLFICVLKIRTTLCVGSTRCAARLGWRTISVVLADHVATMLVECVSPITGSSGQLELIYSAADATTKVNCPITLSCTLYIVVTRADLAWRSGRTSAFDRRTSPVLRSTCSWRVATYVGKPSALGQSTRPTQLFILPESIDDSKTYAITSQW